MTKISLCACLFIWLFTLPGCKTGKKVHKDHSLQNADSAHVVSAVQKPLLLTNFEEYENKHEVFSRELLRLDSIFRYDNYLELINAPDYKPKELSLTIEEEIVFLNVTIQQASDYDELEKQHQLDHITKAASNQKIIVRFMVGSEIDLLPPRTGDISQDAKIYLEKIEKLLSKKENTTGLSFAAYKDFEISRQATTDSKKFIFRKNFIKYLYEKYGIDE